MKKNNNTDRYCPYCHQKEVVFKKVYKDGDILIHSSNQFHLCQNPKCVFYIPIKTYKLYKPILERQFYYVKSNLW
jgi:hypothetical protein